MSTDDAIKFQSQEDFSRQHNPHALLSLQSPDGALIIVTSKPKRFSLTELYDGVAQTFSDGATCVGRILLSVDGEDAAAFLVEGLFPPEGDSTHHTLYVVVNRDEIEYTLMIHYPLAQGDEGLEWSVQLLKDFKWNKTKK